MTRLKRTGDRVEIEFDDDEPGMLLSLLDQYTTLVTDGQADPAFGRLFPDGYRDDPHAAAEFSQYTRDSLGARKRANAHAVAEVVRAGSPVRLTAEDAAPWLPLLTDLRLVVAERLGIRADGDPIPAGVLAELYEWLGQLQWFLVDLLEDDLDARDKTDPA